MTKTTTRKFTLTGAASLLALTLAAGNAAAEEQQFDIEAQPLAKALLAFNEQSGLIVAAPRDLVANKSAPAVRGEMEPEEALGKILSGSGLKSTELSTGGYTITLASVDATESGPRPFRVAQVTQQETIRDVGGQGEDEESVQDTIIVTGTNIRGIAPASSPTRSFDRDDIELTGAATAQDFIQTLPQNFGGSSNPDIVGGGLPSGEGVGFNTSFGASANLRGLGQGSTLVLLNGRRMAPSSAVGDFVDISMIPVAAIDRVDVLLDGASSIYGADAVAGVVNFVLRDDYDGVAGSVRYGTATEGDLDEYRVSGLAGNTWSNGNALISYEFLSQGALSAADRSFSQGAMLPQDLMPSQKRHSAFARTRQDLSPTFEAFADILYSNRRAELNSFDAASTFVFQEPESQTWNATLGGTGTSLQIG